MTPILHRGEKVQQGTVITIAVPPGCIPSSQARRWFSCFFQLCKDPLLGRNKATFTNLNELVMKQNIMSRNLKANITFRHKLTANSEPTACSREHGHRPELRGQHFSKVLGRRHSPWELKDHLEKKYNKLFCQKNYNLVIRQLTLSEKSVLLQSSFHFAPFCM